MATQIKEKVVLKPVGNRAILKRLEKEEKSKGGIILPDSAQKKQEQAVVIAIGQGKPNKEGGFYPMSVKVGDTVLMDKYSGQEVTIDDEEFLIVKEDDIIAIIQK